MIKIKLKKLTLSGFTLIELLVVISIIGLLSAIIINNFNDARIRGSDSKKKSELQNLKKALQMYYNDNNEYPASSDGVIVCNGGNNCGEGDTFQNTNGTVYMKTLPAYTRYTRPTTDSFCLYTELDNLSDGDISRSQSQCSSCPAQSNNFVVCED